MARSPYRQASLPLLMLLVGLAAVLLALQLPGSGVGRNHDPGPRAFPLLLGGIIMLLAVVEGVKAWRGRDGHSANLGRGLPLVEEGDEAGDGEAWPRPLLSPWLFFGSFLLYLGLVWWAGFFVATSLSLLLFLRRLGVGWVVAFISMVVLLGAVYLLFVRLFRVLLPGGFLF
jgi:hypothetical protein